MTSPPLFIDHITLQVSDLEASRRFYAGALGPWGAREHEAVEAYAYGPPGREDLLIASGEPGPPVHVALAAFDRATVDAFHAAALGAGGRDNGAPGLRPRYHAGYYAAYVLDPDGNNIEAVFHDRQPSAGGQPPE
jgi:catechol 2,3-dioxygenase-like lactoylglutathione lyase family enzyme